MKGGRRIKIKEVLPLLQIGTWRILTFVNNSLVPEYRLNKISIQVFVKSSKIYL